MNPAEGAVTAAAFYTPPGSYAPSHLLSGSADGAVSVWAAGGGWEAMKTMRGHRQGQRARVDHVAQMTDVCVRAAGGSWQATKTMCGREARAREPSAARVRRCSQSSELRTARSSRGPPRPATPAGDARVTSPVTTHHHRLLRCQQPCRKEITAIAVHPSGKLALTSSR